MKAGAHSTDAATDPTTPGATPLRWDIIELLFFAYRDFVGDAPIMFWRSSVSAGPTTAWSIS